MEAPKLGTLVAGKYSLVRLIGEGVGSFRCYGPEVVFAGVADGGGDANHPEEWWAITRFRTSRPAGVTCHSFSRVTRFNPASKR